MNLDIKDWGEFKISKLFTLENGKANQGMLEEGNECFYVGAKKDNNGVMIHCAHNSSLVQKGNCIIFICNGQGSVGYANYMDIDFIGTTDIVAGYNKNLNNYNGLFIATVLCMERPKYSFGRKWKTHLKDTIIKLPVKHNTDKTPFIDETHKYSEEGYLPDWVFMEKYIKSLHSKPLTTKNKNKKIPALNVDKWKEFSLDAIFKFKPTKGLDSTELIEGDDITYIGAKHEDNGFVKRCVLDGFENWVSTGNCIVFIQLGEGSAGYANYIPEDFIGMGGKTICGYLIDQEMTPAIGVFLETILCLERPKYSFGRSWTGDRLRKTKIKLPAKKMKNGKVVPDWQFMEDYIKALPYGDRI